MNGNIHPAQSALNSNGPQDYLSRRSNLLLLGMGLALFVAIRLRGLTASCLWFDEIFSVHAARHNWTELLSFVDVAGNSKFKVAVIKDMPGVTEDTAYFLPRQFGDIAVHDEFAPLGDNFWISIRARQSDQMPDPLSFFRRQGYRAGPLIKRKGQGQEAFLIRLRRE